MQAHSLGRTALLETMEQRTKLTLLGSQQVAQGLMQPLGQLVGLDGENRAFGRWISVDCGGLGRSAPVVMKKMAHSQWCWLRMRKKNASGRKHSLK